MSGVWVVVGAAPHLTQRPRAHLETRDAHLAILGGYIRPRVTRPRGPCSRDVSVGVRALFLILEKNHILHVNMRAIISPLRSLQGLSSLTGHQPVAIPVATYPGARKRLTARSNISNAPLLVEPTHLRGALALSLNAESR